LIFKFYIFRRRFKMSRSKLEIGKLIAGLSLLGILCFLLSVGSIARAEVPPGCPDNLNNYWKLDETGGTTFYDSVSGINATCTGDACPASTASGKIGNALIFDGYNDGLGVPADASFNWQNNESFSIEFWINPAGTCTTNQVVVGRYAGTTSWWVGIRCTSGVGRIYFHTKDTNGVTHNLEGTTVLTAGNWYHVAAVRDAGATQVRLYVNGVREGPLQSTTFTGNFTSSAGVTIGWFDVDPYYHFAGIIDEVAIYYDRALSEPEIGSHYYLVRDYCEMCDTDVRIMPLGDSITWGNSDAVTDIYYDVGYRQQLYLDLIGSGYNVDFAGSLQTGSSATPSFDIDHEGHLGYRADQVATNIYSWLSSNTADVILLHIGTNDISGNNEDPQEVADILDEIDSFNEDITVVLARIISRTDGKAAQTTAFNNDVEAMAINRSANGDKIIIVDQESALNYDDDMDGDLHPNEDGYAKMANVWLNELSYFLPVCSAVPSPAVITSNPVTLAALGQPYTYDVEATGNPVPTYSLITFPSGMTINESTGLIQWTPGATGTFNVTVRATNSEGIDEQSFTILVLTCPSDMSHYWKLDETAQPYIDFYGGNNATCTNCPTPTSGRIDGAQHFSSGNQVKVADDNTFDWSGSESFSMELWIKPDAVCSSNQVAIGRWDSSSLYWWVGCSASGRAAFQLKDSSGETHNLAGTTVLTGDTWYHIAAVRDATNADPAEREVRLYVNGVQEDVEYATFPGNFVSSAGVTIGWFDISPFYYFAGAIDEVAIYNKALSLSEIQEHYVSGSAGAGYCAMPSSTLTVSGSGNGTGTVSGSGINCSITNGATSGDCSEAFSPGTNVTLTATAGSGSTFSGWAGDCSGTGSCNLTMDSNKNVTAGFELADTHTLTINGSGTGSGTVTGNGINCVITNGIAGGDCTEDYELGTVVTLTASANADSVFAGWSGGGCSGTGQCVITINAAKTVTAEFRGRYSISGTVTFQLRPFADVTVTLSGAANLSVKTDRFGRYTFTGLANGNYTITPGKAGYSFTPAFRPVLLNNANVTGQNFAGSYGSSVVDTYSISGTVTNAGNPLPGVTVALSGSAVAATTTDGSGNYTFSGLANGDYTIAPSLAEYSFTPASKSVTINNGNLTDQNFSGTYTGVAGNYSISGTITWQLRPFADVTVTLSGDASRTVNTDRFGRYTFTGLANGNYTITPGKAGYTFTPVDRSVTVNNANVTGQNFSSW
jgi:lysophospholipase L1-like esterase